MAKSGKDVIRPPVGHVTILEHLRAVLTEMDLRNQQRFEAQTMAVDATVLAQKEMTALALNAAEKAVTTAMTAAEKAVAKAEVASEKRFDAVNEFRAQLSDQASTFMPRVESEQRMQALAEKIDFLRTSELGGAGRAAGLNAGWLYLLGGLSAVSTLISIYLALSMSH